MMMTNSRNLPPKKRADDGDWCGAFLIAYANCGIIKAAAAAAGVNRRTVLDYRKRHAWFEERYRDAQEDAADVLEAIAQKRAKESSDVLLIFLLKGLRPET